jgi:CIC family chloride channel protein
LPATNASLAKLTANDILHSDPPTIAESATLAELEHVFVQRRWQHVYVVDHAGHFLGAVSLHDFGPHMHSAASPEAALPPQLIHTSYPRVQGNLALEQVLEAFTTHSGERLPVVNSNDTLRGYVSKSDLLRMLQTRASLI